MLSDITYVATRSGWLYVVGIMDLCSRKIVGWSMSESLKSDFLLDAFNMMLKRLKLEDDAIFHSDRGVQYVCHAFRRLLKEHGIRQSMSRRGNCYDNAPMESFFHTLKTELIYHHDFIDQNHARRVIFEWIESFYNRKRLHSSIGYVSPVAFEEEFVLDAA